MSGLHRTKIQWATHHVIPIGAAGLYSRLELDQLRSVLRWQKPATIYWAGALFQEGVPDAWIDLCFEAMALTPHLRHIVLTTRAKRMQAYMTQWYLLAQRFGDGPRHGLPNVALGVLVSDQDEADELVPYLLDTPAALRFVSYEPATGPVNWYRAAERVEGAGGHGIDCIIIGGESGKDARAFDLAWARSTIRQCEAAGAVAMVRQLGAVCYHVCDGCNALSDTGVPCAGHRVLLRDPVGGDPAKWPEDLRPYAASVKRWPWPEVGA